MTLTLALLIAVQAQSWQVTLDSLARNGEFSGVVLVARGGVPQFERAYINLGSINNAGYIVLGLLIERLSGENYHEYVRRLIRTALAP